MDSNSITDTTTKNNNLITALREVQESLQRLGSELDVSAKSITRRSSGPKSNSMESDPMKVVDEVVDGQLTVSVYDWATGTPSKCDFPCNMPTSEWCFVTAESAPKCRNLITPNRFSLQCAIEVQIDATMEPNLWTELPLEDSIVKWKYC